MTSLPALIRSGGASVGAARATRGNATAKTPAPNCRRPIPITHTPPSSPAQMIAPNTKRTKVFCFFFSKKKRFLSPRAFRQESKRFFFEKKKQKTFMT
jgi:hypothetical protein